MTMPIPVTAASLARRAEEEIASRPPVRLETRGDVGADIGELHPRVSHFDPPRPSFADIERSGSRVSRPTGVARGSVLTYPRPGLGAPEGVRLFSTPRSPEDAEAIGRLGRELLRESRRPRPRGNHPQHQDRNTPVTPERHPAPPHPTQEDCRRHLAAFRNAMGEFTRARYFGGEDRLRLASEALDRAREAYAHLYSDLPLNPAMSSILDGLNSRVEGAEAYMATMRPSRRSHR